MEEKFNLGRSVRPGKGKKMVELTEKRDLGVIAEEIRMCAAEIRMYTNAGQRVTLLDVIQIGKKLAEAEELLQQCVWLLPEQMNYTEQQVKNCIRLFHEYGMELI